MQHLNFFLSVKNVIFNEKHILLISLEFPLLSRTKKCSLEIGGQLSSYVKYFILEDLLNPVK